MTPSPSSRMRIPPLWLSIVLGQKGPLIDWLLGTPSPRTKDVWSVMCMAIVEHLPVNDAVWGALWQGLRSSRYRRKALRQAAFWRNGPALSWMCRQPDAPIHDPVALHWVARELPSHVSLLGARTTATQACKLALMGSYPPIVTRTLDALAPYLPTEQTLTIARRALQLGVALPESMQAQVTRHELGLTLPAGQTALSPRARL